MSITDILLSFSSGFFFILVFSGLTGNIKFTGLLGIITITVLFYGFGVLEGGEAALLISGNVWGVLAAKFLKLDET